MAQYLKRVRKSQKIMNRLELQLITMLIMKSVDLVVNIQRVVQVESV